MIVHTYYIVHGSKKKLFSTFKGAFNEFGSVNLPIEQWI
jgi:hypothetical protein